MTTRWRWQAFPSALAVSLASVAWADCNFTSSGNVPLSDLGTGFYLSVEGGLYPFGAENPPPAHEAEARLRALDEIALRDATGALTSDPAIGRIVMISVGMSNTTQEFSTFVTRLGSELADSPQLVVVDGAQGGQDVFDWASPSAPTWSTVDARLASAGVTPAQVQVAWIKQAIAGASTHGAFPSHAQALEAGLGDVVRSLKTRYPNVKLAFISSRTRSYQNIPTALNPEPFAYEAGFATRWLIEAQLGGDPSLAYAGSSAVAPLLLWGPYLWADGTTPRSDGFTWLCSDLQPDFTHPSPSGRTKVADQLLAFFKTDPLSTPWFLRANGVNPPALTSTGVSATSGSAPLSVTFNALAQDVGGTITGYAWTFDDGTFSLAQNPGKTFRAGGVYNARVTASDNDGNTARASLRVAVSSPAVALIGANADAAVQSSTPTTNFGTQKNVLVAGNGSAATRLAYLRFDVLGPPTVRRAVLHLNVLDPGSPVEVHLATSSVWGETSLTWNTRPSVDPLVVATFTPRQTGPIEIDVTSALPPSGPVTFVLQTTAGDQSSYATREANNPGTRPLLEIR